MKKFDWTKILYFFIITFFYLLNQNLFSQQRTTIAIVGFEGKDKELSSGITEVFLTDLSKSDKLTIVERKQLDKALQETKKGLSGFIEDGTAVEVGKLTGANKIIVGSYLQTDGKMIINARMLDVRTAKVEKALNREGEKSNLYYIIHQLANDFHRALTGRWIPELLPEDLAKTPEGKLEILKQIDPSIFLNNPKAEFKVKVWLNKKDNPTYKQEESMVISFEADADSYLTIFNIDSEGRISLLFPNSYATNNKVKKGKTYTIPGKDDPYEFSLSGIAGEELIIAVATLEPLELIKDMDKLVESNFMPEVAQNPSEFITRAVHVKLKGSPQSRWSSGKVKFYLEEK